MQNNAGHCQQTFKNKKFVDITQQCFALLLQVNFPANNLNFHWRWRLWDQIQAIFLYLFYFNIFVLFPNSLVELIFNMSGRPKVVSWVHSTCRQFMMHSKLSIAAVGTSNFHHQSAISISKHLPCLVCLVQTILTDACIRFFW